MRKQQLEHWVHADKQAEHAIPKIFVISCADSTSYQLAVEFKHKLEPIVIEGQPIKYASIDQVKDELARLGVDSAYLRLHNAYDECGPDPVQMYHDIELSIIKH